MVCDVQADIAKLESEQQGGPQQVGRNNAYFCLSNCY